MFNKIETVFLIGGKNNEKYENITKYNFHDEVYQTQYSQIINETPYRIFNLMYMEDNFPNFFNQEKINLEEIALVVCIGMERDLISAYANEMNCLFVDFETAGYLDINSLLSACLDKNTPLETAEDKTLAFTKMCLLKTGMQIKESPFCNTPIELINQILQLYMRLNFKTYQPFSFFEPKIDSNSFMFKLLNFVDSIKQSIENIQKEFNDGLDAIENRLN